MIDGVETKKLKLIPDERGRLMELLRRDEPIFDEFGQLYMTTAYPGVIKAWHYHKKQKDMFICIKGAIKLVLYDSRKGSPTKGEVNQFFIGENNPMLVKIPKDVFHGFKAIGTEEAVIINIPTNTYNPKDPDEFRLPFNSREIPYSWDIQMK